MSDEWGPWIEHDGLGCPVVRGAWVHAKDHLGETMEFVSSGPEVMLPGFANSWTITQPCYVMKPWGLHLLYPIIRYRIRKPRGLTILEQIAANPPKAPIRKPVMVPE